MKRSVRDLILFWNKFENHFLNLWFLSIPFVVIPTHYAPFLVIFRYFRDYKYHDSATHIFQNSLVHFMELFVTRRMRMPLPYNIHVSIILELSHVIKLWFLIPHPWTRLLMLFGPLYVDVGIHFILFTDSEIFLSFGKQPSMYDVRILFRCFLSNIVE